MFIAVTEIKAGKRFHTSHKVDFKNYMNKIRYNAMVGIPLLREITATLEYCAIKTCLKFTDFLLLNDIKVYMLEAKIQFLKKEKNPVGRNINRVVQYATAIGFIAILVGALTFPLYIFSNKKSSAAYNITSGNFKIKLLDHKDRHLKTLFKATVLEDNIEDLT